jgi:tRNA (guanine-N7-)-methyltransferase
VSRRLKTDIPGRDWRVRAEELREPGLEKLFAPLPARPLVVDVGFGRGEFLLALANEAPGAAFLGIEVSGKRVLKMARRLAKTQLANVRLVQGAAEGVLEALPAGAVEVFWINFPDPWPKKRHQRRRLLQAPIVERLASRLAPGGRLEVATDHAEYAEQIQGLLSAQSGLENLYAPEPFRRAAGDRPPTAYELEWRAAGRACHYFCYRRAAR